MYVWIQQNTFVVYYFICTHKKRKPLYILYMKKTWFGLSNRAHRGQKKK